MHYSDIPPTGAAAGSIAPRKIEPAVTNPSDIENARRDLQKNEMEFKKRQQAGAEAGAKAEKDKADAEVKQRNCAQAQSYLRALEAGERISRTNEKGERLFLDDQGRSQEIVAARRSVESWCK